MSRTNSRSFRATGRVSRRKFLALAVLTGFAFLVWPRSIVSVEKIVLDFWQAGELKSELDRSETRHAEINRRSEEIFSRVTARRRILDNCLSGNITLEEAGKGFLAINQSEPVVLSYLRTMFPEGTDLDRAIRQVKLQLLASESTSQVRVAVRMTNDRATSRTVWRGECGRGMRRSGCEHFDR